jgi:hypothetical protein
VPPQSFRQAKNRFRRSLETVSRRFEHVLDSVYRLSVDIIKVRYLTYSTIHSRLQEARFSPHIDNCIGAIDGTHIPSKCHLQKCINMWAGMVVLVRMCWLYVTST